MSAFVHIVGVGPAAIPGLVPVAVEWGGEPVEETVPRHRFGGLELHEIPLPGHLARLGRTDGLDIASAVVAAWRVEQLPIDEERDLRALIDAASTSGLPWYCVYDDDATGHGRVDATSSPEDVVELMASHMRRRAALVVIRVEPGLGPSPRLPEKAARALLDTLIAKHGFCVPPDEQERLATRPPLTPSAFLDAVYRAEGMELPPTTPSQLRRMLAVIAEAYADAGVTHTT